MLLLSLLSFVNFCFVGVFFVVLFCVTFVTCQFLFCGFCGICVTMGNKPSVDGRIVKKSPLGCILKLWKQIGGDPRIKRQLIEYYNHWWPIYKWDDQEKWPKNKNLEYNTMLQLMLFCRREKKWDEVPYVDLVFFTLQNHP